MASSLAQQDVSILEIGSIVKKSVDGGSTSSSHNTSPTSQSSSSILSSFGSIFPVKPYNIKAAKIGPTLEHDLANQNANVKPKACLCDLDDSIIELGPLSIKPYIDTEFNVDHGTYSSPQSTELMTLVRDAANRAFLKSLFNSNTSMKMSAPAVTTCAGKHSLTTKSPWVTVCTKDASSSSLALAVWVLITSNSNGFLPELDLATTEMQLEKMTEEIEHEGVAVHEAIQASEANCKYPKVEHRIPLPPREEGIQFEEYAAFSCMTALHPMEDFDTVSLTPTTAFCPRSLQELPTFGTRLEECSNTLAGLLDATIQSNPKEPILLEWLDVAQPSDLDTLIGNAGCAELPLDYSVVKYRWPKAPTTDGRPRYTESDFQEIFNLNGAEEDVREGISDFACSAQDICQKAAGEVAIVKIPSRDFGNAVQEPDRSEAVVFTFSGPLFGKSISGLPIAPVDTDKISQIEDALDVFSRELRGLSWALHPELDLASTAEQMQWLKGTIDTRTSAADSCSFSPKKNAGTPYIREITRSYAPPNADAYVQYHFDAEGEPWFFAEARTYWAWMTFALREHWALFGKNHPALLESNPASVLRQLLNLPEKPVITGNTQCLYEECEDEAPIPEKHHINFLGQWFHEKSGTSPAVSLWAASVGQRFEVAADTLLHDAVVSSQASKRIDPVQYDGDINEIPDLQGDELREFVQGSVHTTYASFGSWQYDDYAEDENNPSHIAGPHLEAQFDENGQLQGCEGLHLPRYVTNDDDDINVNDDGTGRHPSSTKLKKSKGFDTRGGSPLRIAHAAPPGAPTFVVDLAREAENRLHGYQDTHQNTITVDEVSEVQACDAGDQSSEAETTIEDDGLQQTRMVVHHVDEMATNADSPPSHVFPAQQAEQVAIDKESSMPNASNSANTELTPKATPIDCGQGNATEKIVDAFGKIAPNDPDVPQWYKDYMKVMEVRYAAQQKELKVARIKSAAAIVTPLRDGRHISAEKMLATPTIGEPESPVKCLGSWEQNENGDFLTPANSLTRATTCPDSPVAAEPVRKTALINLRTAKNVLMLKRIFPVQAEAKTSGLALSPLQSTTPLKQTANPPLEISRYFYQPDPRKKSGSAALQSKSFYSEDYGVVEDDEIWYSSRIRPSSDWLRKDIFKGYKSNKVNNVRPAMQIPEGFDLDDGDVFNDAQTSDDDRSETSEDEYRELQLGQLQSTPLSPIKETDSQAGQVSPLWVPKQRRAVKRSRYPVVTRNVSRIHVPSLEPSIVEDEEVYLGDDEMAPMNPETKQELDLQAKVRLAGIQASAIWAGVLDDEDDQIADHELSLGDGNIVPMSAEIKEQPALQKAANFAGPRKFVVWDGKAGDEDNLTSRCEKNTVDGAEASYDGKDVSSPSPETAKVLAWHEAAMLAGMRLPVFWDDKTYDVTGFSSKSTSPIGSSPIDSSPVGSLFSKYSQQSRSSSVSTVPSRGLNVNEQTAAKKEAENEEKTETSGLDQASGETAPEVSAPAKTNPRNVTINFYTVFSIPPSCNCSAALTTTSSRPPKPLLTGVPTAPGDILEMENSTGYAGDAALIPNRQGVLTVNSLADLIYVGWRVARWIIGW